MNIQTISKENGLEGLFYEKLCLFSNSWDGTIPIKEVNRKFSLLFLTKEQTFLILKILQSKGMIQIKKTFVVIK
jgi:hypothetical protein